MTIPPKRIDSDDRIGAGDAVLFHIPIIGRPVTINEWHAVAIGWVGFILGGLFIAGLPSIALTILALLAVYAIIGKPVCRSLDRDDPAYRYPIGLMTIRYEPWYFLASMLLSFGAGVGGIGVVLPAVMALPFLLIATSRPARTRPPPTPDSDSDPDPDSRS